MRDDVEVVSLADRPDLQGPVWDMPTDWPAFMDADPVADVWFSRLATDFPAHQLAAVRADGQVVGKLNAIPFAWDGTEDGLPDRGWDAVLERGFRDLRRSREPSAVSLLEARVVPELRGTGLAVRLLRAAKDVTAQRGLADLFGPVRPTRKAEEPHLPMAQYIRLTRPDGLPTDPWLRTHVRLGGRVVKVCPTSMTVPGTLAQWRGWTGLPFDVSGPLEVPGALVPVHVDVEQDHAVYVEPNVWVHHSCA